MLLSEKIAKLQAALNEHGEMHIHWDNCPTEGGYTYGTIRSMEYYWYIHGNQNDITNDYIQKYGFGPFIDYQAMSWHYSQEKLPIRGMQNVTIKIIPHETEQMICF